MKNKIFMYLFFFSVLFILYQYVSAEKYFESEKQKMESKEAELAQLNDTIQALRLENMDLRYFDLKTNDDALAYYEHLEIADPAAYVRDKLIESNENSGNNPLVPYDGMSGAPMKINKIKILNHKWLIADFSDGKYWGELMIEYQLNDDLSVDFTVLDHLLYTRN
ncbi:hydrolase [Robertkochia aurantiaca]|uniref:hydrolase n=1 Tax=Robertkochia aurantiaca TaxID=2873700 RepID=UPI001CCA349B|nr:hydrolase [Robertkochia sp. 3YJGBD-33]